MIYLRLNLNFPHRAFFSLVPLFLAFNFNRIHYRFGYERFFLFPIYGSTTDVTSFEVLKSSPCFQPVQIYFSSPFSSLWLHFPPHDPSSVVAFRGQTIPFSPFSLLFYWRSYGNRRRRCFPFLFLFESSASVFPLDVDFPPFSISLFLASSIKRKIFRSVGRSFIPCGKFRKCPGFGFSSLFQYL